MAKKKSDKILDDEIINQAKNLVKQLQDGDVSSARSLIGQLNEIREASLFHELGKLTRELHDTLKTIDVGGTGQSLPGSKNKLTYVIEMTEKAANTTMDGIEFTIPLSSDLAKQSTKLLDEWGKLGRHEMKVEEFRKLYKEMMKFLGSVESTSESIHSKLQEVLVAQNYQDLTGQAIKKVMGVVSDVEKKLVHLIAITAEAGYSPEEENKTEESRSTAGTEVKGQDEVDDLLSSLGF